MALAKWVEFFEDFQFVRGRSRNTVLAYRRDLNLYDEFRQKHSELTLIFDFMTRRGLSARSQARVISCIKTYYRFCQLQDMKIPDLDLLKSPRVEIGLPKALSESEFSSLYQACASDSTYKTGRNQMTLLLLFGLGCRVTELIGLSLQDYNATDGWLKIIGKGKKERLVPLTDGLRQELNDYLSYIRGNLIRGDIKTGSILINDRSARPSRVDVWRWLAHWSKVAGFEKTIHPHKFRHGCATSLLESGADLRSIQMLLGHASIQTTQMYTSVTKTHLREAIAEHHPLKDTDFEVKST